MEIPKNLITQKVSRGPFLISLSVQGNLDSQKNATLLCLVEGSTTIISLIPEGTIVSAGDVLCELDSSVLRDKAKQQEIKVTQAEALLAQAREALEIQKTQNESDISASELKLELAKLDLEKYLLGDFSLETNELGGNIELAVEELLRAEENLDFTKEQVKKGYRTQNDQEAARIAVKQAELKLQVAKEKLTVLTDYTSKRNIAELEANAKEFVLELKRTELKAKASLTQAEKDVEALKLTYDVEKEQYERMLQQIEACILKAPQAGEVVYANMSSSSRRSSEPTAIEEGATVRERQAIINLPDVTQMKVDCRIHESLIGSIRKGLSARIRIDAYPEQVFNGVISTVSSVPMSGSWPNTDLREYATSIHLTDSVEIISKLRPGLTAQVEIQVDNRDQVLQVPVQAVVTVINQQIAYIYKNGSSEQRKLKVGQSNQTHIEILDGIEEGEEVILNPRSQFAEAIAELEGLLNTEKTDQENADAKARSSAAALEEAKPAPPEVNSDSPQPPPGGNPGAAFERFDADKDGKLTQSELPERMQSRFAELDTDRDGSITQAEFTAGSKNFQRPPAQ